MPSEVRERDQQIDRADEVAPLVPQRRGVRGEGHTPAVRPLGHGMDAANLAVFAHGNRHRALVGRKKLPVFGVQISSCLASYRHSSG
jgi:hypothetical protein